ncbi:7565_t:CDS:2, partial [Cetraspora pellucida]
MPPKRTFKQTTKKQKLAIVMFIENPKNYNIIDRNAATSAPISGKPITKNAGFAQIALFRKTKCSTYYLENFGLNNEILEDQNKNELNNEKDNIRNEKSSLLFILDEITLDDELDKTLSNNDKLTVIANKKTSVKDIYFRTKQKSLQNEQEQIAIKIKIAEIKEFE